MPNTKSAKKALRSSQKKAKTNTSIRYKIKAAIKELRVCLAENPEQYLATLSKAYSALDKAGKKNTIHKNKVNRKKSRLALLVKKTVSISQKA